MATEYKFGKDAPPLQEQMGWPANNEVATYTASLLQKDADAITLLSDGGFLNKKETEKARRKLVRMIEDNRRYPGF